MFGNFRAMRTFLICITLFAGCLYIGVAFLGADWGDQGRYLLTLLKLLLAILLCAAVLLAVFKGVGKVWDWLVSRRDSEFDLPDTSGTPPKSERPDDP